jgi:hypothetical protein
MNLLRFVFNCLWMAIIFFMTPCKCQLLGSQQIATSTTPYATAYGNGHKIAVTNSYYTDTIYVVFASGNQVYCVTGVLQLGYVTQWSLPLTISQTTGNAFGPAITLDTANIPHIVWRDTRDGQKEIYHSFCQDTSWSPPANVSQTSGNSVLPSLDADRFGNLHLVYADSTIGNWEIYYQRCQNGSWSNPTNISNNSGRSYYPTIGVYHDSIFICWEDNTLGNYEIFKKVCADTLWTNIANISNSTYDSRYPSLSNPSSWDQAFSVIWTDSLSDGYSINVIGCNGGTITDKASVAEYPVISNVGTTWSYMAWVEGFSLFASTYYFMHGGWDSPSTFGTGYFPSVAGDNFIWTEDSSGSYNIKYAEAGYPIGVSNLPTKQSINSLIMYVQPNPFKDKIHISLNANDGQSLVFNVYDLTGRRVKSWSTSLKNNHFEWNGKNDAGVNLPGGVYFLNVKTGNKQDIKKIVKIK